MPKGGARINSGPPPDPKSLRSSAQAAAGDWLTLPVGGHSGPAPIWPFPKGSTRERAIWAKLWRTPQAAAWVKLGVWPNDVALFVRLSVDAEQGDLKAASEARQWNDRLGLNPDAMLRKRWRISTDEVEAKRKPAEVKRTSSRSRLKVVDGGS